MNTEINNTKEGMRVYEIGYLLIPNIPDEKVEGETKKILDLIAKYKGDILGQEAPQKKTLTYQMVKKVGAVNHKYREGFFGWVKFELGQGDINEVKTALDINPSVLRYLLINTVKENTYLGEGAKTLIKELIKENETVDEEGKVIVPDVAVIPASPEEIDKSIDEMVNKSA